MVDDELGDGAEIMLLSQVKVSLRSGADVIMSAACTSFSVESVVRVSQEVIRRDSWEHWDEKLQQGD